jgi:SAM-dependent methyltransferase
MISFFTSEIVETNGVEISKIIIDKTNHICYNDIANEYDDDDHATCRDFNYCTSVFLNEFFTSPKHKIKNNMKYLDIGVGTGKTLETKFNNSNNLLIDLLIEKKCSIDVLDFSEKMIEIVKNKFGDKINNYINESIFDFKSEIKYDIIVAALCDPYLTREFLDIASKILENGGHLILTYPSTSWAKQTRENSNINKIIYKNKNGKKYDSYSFCWEATNLLEYLKKSGLHNKKLNNYFLKELKENKNMSALNNSILFKNDDAGFCTAIALYKLITTGDRHK